MRDRAFSLIELLVVIAIVAILSALAIPVYQSYIKGSRASALIGPMDSMVQKAIIFANQNGVFPTPTQLIGYGTGTVARDPGFSTNNAAMNAGDISTAYGHPSACGAAGKISINVKPEGFGSMVISCLMAHKNNTVQTKCYYSYSRKNNVFLGTGNFAFASSPSSGDVIPGLTNVQSNLGTVATDFFSGSTCM